MFISVLLVMNYFHYLINIFEEYRRTKEEEEKTKHDFVIVQQLQNRSLFLQF